MKKTQTYIQYLPIVGILAFVSFYLIAVDLYPGGSDFNRSAIGFDWKYNYWCNLNYRVALNGEINPGRQYSIVGMYVLAASLLYFFYEFPLYFRLNKVWKQTIRISGFLSMFCAVLIHTEYHDILTYLSALFGMISLAGVVIGLRRRKMKNFLWTGVLCIVLILINGTIYYIQQFTIVLPILQKVTFGFILVWIALVNSRFGVRKYEKTVN